MHKEVTYQFKLRIYSFALIAMFIVAIFFPILSYGWLGIEDTSYYQTNPLFSSGKLLPSLIASWFHAPESNYIPLTWNFTILLAKATSNNPQAFHAFSLFLHLINSLLAFIFLGRIGFKFFPAAITVLFFALHPLRVESVAWASSIKGLLTTCFALSSLLIQTSPKVKFRSLMIIGFFLLALLCKQTLLLLPCVHFLLAVSLPAYQVRKSTYALLGILSILAAITASSANTDNALLTVNQINEGNFAPLKAVSALGHYIKLHFLPFPLFPEYPTSKTWWEILIGLLFFIPLTALLIRLLKPTKRPTLSLSLFACFFILLFPTLGFISTPLEFAADRLSYLPSLFFWAALIGLITQDRTLNSYQKNKPIIITLVLLLIFFTTLTHHQLKHWKDDSSLTSHILRHQPDHYLANLHYANKLASEGEFQKALPIAKNTTKVYPNRYGAQQTLSRIYLSMGTPNSSLKDLNAALSHPTPIRADLYVLQSDALRALKRYSEALKSINLAQSNGMDTLTIHYHKALIYHASGQIQNAQSEINHALQINPRSLPVLKLKAQVTSGAN